MENILPVDLLHWVMALLPILALLVMLVFLKWSGPVSGWIAMLISGVIALTFFKTPLVGIGIAFGKGLWDALFILLVVLTALVLYQITKEAGAFAVIREGIQEHSQNHLFLVLAFGWVFASLLQGVAGFGAPIAIVAPLLVGIGVKPLMAVAIPLIGHAWANMLGSLAVSWIATINLIDISDEPLTLLYMSILLWIVNFMSGITICFLFARWKGIKEGLLAVCLISLIHGGGQLILSQINPALSNFIPGILGLGVMFLLVKINKYREKTKLDEETDILIEEKKDTTTSKSGISLHKAFMPYYVLIVLSVVMLGIPFIQEALGQFKFGIGFRGVETGYGYTVDAVNSYSPIAILTHPGTYLLISSIFGFFWFKHLGLYNEDSKKHILTGIKDNGVGAVFSISGFLTMSQIMSGTGQTTLLALGIASVAPAVLYVALSNVIGVLGAFMTSSNTASNVIFSPLHASVTSSIEGLTLPIVIAGQSAGGAIGNAIAPANVILGTSTVGNEEDNSKVLRITLVYAVLTSIIVSLVSVLIFYLA